MGHGTGQHALYFSKHFSQIKWHAADVSEYHWVLRERLKIDGPQNLIGPLNLMISKESTIQKQLQEKKFDYFFTANTLHIMCEEHVMIFCEEIKNVLNDQALLFLYGPFKFNHHFTSSSNEEFDQVLRSRGSGSGIRDFEMIENKFKSFGIHFLKRFDLPANNQLLVFQNAS